MVETASRDFVIGLGYKIVNFNLFSGRNVKDSKNRVSHDLALRADISFRNQSALCRDIQQGFAQATNGNKALKISCSADYTLSRLLTLRLYYDRQQNTPLVSSSSYPVVSADFGFNIKNILRCKYTPTIKEQFKGKSYLCEINNKQYETSKNLHEALVRN